VSETSTDHVLSTLLAGTEDVLEEQVAILIPRAELVSDNTTFAFEINASLAEDLDRAHAERHGRAGFFQRDR
jgi:hypothetical protein